MNILLFILNIFNLIFRAREWCAPKFKFTRGYVFIRNDSNSA